jgi:hypothetical protein
MKDDAERRIESPVAVYEPPRVEDLGTFAELTQQRTVLLAQDNSGRNGTQ